MSIKKECPLCRTTFANVLHEHTTTAIGHTVVRVDHIDAYEHVVFTMRKRNHLLFASALGVCILYVSFHWNEPCDTPPKYGN